MLWPGASPRSDATGAEAHGCRVGFTFAINVYVWMQASGCPCYIAVKLKCSSSTVRLRCFRVQATDRTKDFRTA